MTKLISLMYDLIVALETEKMNKHIQLSFSNLILDKITESGIHFYSTTSSANDVQGTITVKFTYKMTGKEILQKNSELMQKILFYFEQQQVATKAKEQITIHRALSL